jgi:hypothetical protein
LFYTVIPALFATGCASTWDTVTNKSWQKTLVRQPHRALGFPEDALATIRNNPLDGEKRAKAMRRLAEPAKQGRSAEEQNEALGYLQAAATGDASPVVRAAAIDCLGRFEDPRVPEILTAAFHQANGPGATPKLRTEPGAPGFLSPSLGLTGPGGYSPDVANMLKVKVVEALARTDRPEAVAFLAEQAMPRKDVDAWDARDVRVAAVKGLAKIRRTESVQALAAVLAAENGHDAAIAHHAHAGLVDLTGRDLPPDPEQWKDVVQAGFEVTAPKNAVQRAVDWILP